MKKSLTLMFVLTLSTLVASAAVVEDFESWTGTGTAIADPDNDANTVLALTPGQFVDIALGDSAGVVTVDVYDFGEAALIGSNAYGPRWAIEGYDDAAAAAASAGATIIYRSSLNGSNGYGMGSATSRTGSWFSPSFFGGPRQCTLETWIDTDGDDILDEDQNDGVGQWTTWTFTVDTYGNVEISAPFGGTVEEPGTFQSAWWDGTSMYVPNMDKVWLSGGRSGYSLPVAAGTYMGYAALFDNITLSADEPELHPGDANGDGVVNLDDFIILKQNYGVSPTTWAQGNFNEDDVVNLDDFIILKQNYGWTER